MTPTAENLKPGTLVRWDRSHFGVVVPPVGKQYPGCVEVKNDKTGGIHLLRIESLRFNDTQRKAIRATKRAARKGRKVIAL